MGRGREGEGACSFVACLGYLTIDHVPFSRRSTGEGGGGACNMLRGGLEARAGGRVAIVFAAAFGVGQVWRKKGEEVAVLLSVRGARDGYGMRVARNLCIETTGMFLQGSFDFAVGFLVVLTFFFTLLHVYPCVTQ